MNNINLTRNTKDMKYRGGIKVSEYSLDITGKIDSKDYSTIDDYLQVVTKQDKLKITIDNSSVPESGMICSMLQGSDFYIQSQGKANNGKYYIQAVKQY